MKLLPILLTLPVFLLAQTDPASEAYKAWDKEHPWSDQTGRADSLLKISEEWVAKWPDSKLAWSQRRQALMSTQNQSAELWKQVGTNLIRLNPPHSSARSVAYDWVAANVNLRDAEALLSTEIDWLDARPRSVRPHDPTMADLVAEVDFALSPFSPLCTLASAQIRLKEFDRARLTILRIRRMLDSEFKRYHDQDPLETFPDYEAKDFILSAELAQAEGRTADALALYQQVITNPYYRREYERGYVEHTHSLWKQMGGTEEGWATFSRVAPLPIGVPHLSPGLPLLPWGVIDYKLPNMKAPGLNSRNWTTKDFEGKTTMVYLWASWCAPCWAHLPAIQSLHAKIKDRPDIQIVTLSTDEDVEKAAAFMKEKGYTFPVVVSKPYVDQLLPHVILGQHWIVDKNASVRLLRIPSMFSGADQAFIDESIYKLDQVSKKVR